MAAMLWGAPPPASMALTQGGGPPPEPGAPLAPALAIIFFISQPMRRLL